MEILPPTFLRHNYLQDYPNLFPDFNGSLQAQQMLAGERNKVIPAADFLDIMVRDGLRHGKVFLWILICYYFQPNSERKPLDELNAVDDEDMIDQQVDAKDHPIQSEAPKVTAPGTKSLRLLLSIIICSL